MTARLALVLAFAFSLWGWAAPSASASSCHARGSLPDQVCTPGSLNPDVNQANIHLTICVPGYTLTIRPSRSESGTLKRREMALYGQTGSLTNFQLDHLIPLELGGAPRDPRNLWPEAFLPTPGAHQKDRIENLLHSRVCSGAMTLAAAQHAIAADWTAVR